MAAACCAGAVAVRAADPGAAQPADAAADIEAQYAAVLAAMKMPRATGVLVTEVIPGGAAEAAGIRAGDILVKYRESPIHNLAALRQQLAAALAADAVADAQSEGPASLRPSEVMRSDRAAIELRRADASAVGGMAALTVRVPFAPLAIRARDVEAGLPVEGNLPPSLRGTVAMGWSDLFTQQTGDDASVGATTYYRTFAGDSAPVNWQRRTLRIVGRNEVEGQLDTFQPDTGEGAALVEHVEFTVRGGDYVKEPAFVLLSVQSQGTQGGGAGGPEVAIKAAERAGLRLRPVPATGIGAGGGPVIVNPLPSAKATDVPLDGIIDAAVPVVAAAMPHADGAVLALHLVSLRDMLPRPGYVLATRGKVAIGDMKDTAWRVDLMQCGVVTESFWFDDGRGLIHAEVPAGTPLVTTRVKDEATARTIWVPKDSK